MSGRWYSGAFQANFLALVSVLASLPLVLAAELNPPNSPEARALVEQARREGKVTVTVKVRVSGESSAENKRIEFIQRNLAAQSSVVDRAGVRNELRQVFRHAPLMILRLDEQGLRRLLGDPDVVGVRGPAEEEPQLAEAGPMIRSDELHKRVPSITGAGQSIVIIDSGVDDTHPALTGRVVAGACFSSAGGTLDTTTPSTPNLKPVCPGGQPREYGITAGRNCTIDRCYHGTRVAGAAASADATQRGVAPGASIVAIQVHTEKVDTRDKTMCPSGRGPRCTSSYVDDQLAAFDWLITEIDAGRIRNVAAVNLSMGGSKIYSRATCPDDDRQDHVDQLRVRSITVVFPAGNDGEVGQNLPACIPGALSVASVTKSQDPTQARIHTGHNIDDGVELLAPGVSLSLPTPGGTIVTGVGGTSYAAPQVAGALALIRSQAYRLSEADRIRVLQQTGYPIQTTRKVDGVDVKFTKPLIDVEAAVDLASCRNLPDDCYIVLFDMARIPTVLHAPDAAWVGTKPKLYHSVGPHAGEELREVNVPNDAAGRAAYLTASSFHPSYKGELFHVFIESIADKNQTEVLKTLFKSP